MTKFVILIGMIIVVAAGIVYLSINNQTKGGSSANMAIKTGAVQTTTQPPTTVPSPTIKVVLPTATPAIPALTLKITEPATGFISNTAKVTVKGVTVPQADVFVNEMQLTADAKGNFSTNVTLEEGENYILVSANDEEGKTAEQEIVVTYTVK
jgi:hypothetical protein